MTRVAFCVPYYPGGNHSQFLGVGYLSSCLKKLGHETIILDEDAMHWVKTKTGSTLPKEDTRKWIKKDIDKFDPQLIAISINTTNYHNGLSLLDYLRRSYPEKLIVVGGPHITLCWKTFKKMHREKFDIGIIGEGEITLAKICEKVANNKSISGISGAFTSNDDNVNILMPQMIDIQNIPPPDRQGFLDPFTPEETIVANEHYQRVFYSFLPGFREKKHARVVVTRGCNRKCGFCSPAVYWANPINGNPLRRIRSPQDVAEEIHLLAEQGVKAIYFDDPSFPASSNKDFFYNFKSELKKYGDNIVWGSPMSFDELSEEVLDDLFETGFRYTYIGLESWNDANLSKLKKKQSIEHCLKMVDVCSRKGIHCDISYQVGLPGENLADINKSLDWLIDNNLAKRTFFNITAIWPETQLAKEFGITPLDYEPTRDKKELAEKGLHYFDVYNDLDEYFSNFSGTFHFISYDTAKEIKNMLFAKGFYNRFDLSDEDFEKIEIKQKR